VIKTDDGYLLAPGYLAALEQLAHSKGVAGRGAAERASVKALRHGRRVQQIRYARENGHDLTNPLEDNLTVVHADTGEVLWTALQRVSLETLRSRKGMVGGVHLTMPGLRRLDMEFLDRRFVEVIRVPTQRRAQGPQQSPDLTAP